MTIPDSLISSLIGITIPAIIAWVWRVQNTVTVHAEKFDKLDTVIEKLDQLVNVLLQDRLNK
jgi:hypothetical protein